MCMLRRKRSSDITYFILATKSKIRCECLSLIVGVGLIVLVHILLKLRLSTTKHPILRLLQWLNDNGEMKVNQQVNVNFFIGKFEEKLCVM